MVLVKRKDVSLTDLEQLMDKLYCFHDHPPPMLLVGGAVRQAVHAAFASLTMYYGERYLNNEMLTSCSAMRDAFNTTIFGKGGLNAYDTYIMWGKELKAQFDTDNLHLTARAQHEPMDKVVGAIETLSRTVSSLQAAMMTQSVRLEGCESMLKIALAAMNTTPTKPSPMPPSPAVALRTALTEASNLAEASNSDAADAAAAAALSAAVSAAVVSNAAAAASSSWLQDATDGVPLKLSYFKGTPDPIVKFTKLHASDFFVMW